MFGKFRFKNRDYWQVLSCCQIVAKEVSEEKGNRDWMAPSIELFHNHSSQYKLSYGLHGINGTPKGRGVGLKRFNNILAQYGYDGYSVDISEKGDWYDTKMLFQLCAFVREDDKGRPFATRELLWSIRDERNRLNHQEIFQQLNDFWKFDYTYVKYLPFYCDPESGNPYNAGRLFGPKFDRQHFFWWDHAYQLLHGKLKDFYPVSIVNESQKKRLEAIGQTVDRNFGKKQYEINWSDDEILELKNKHSDLTIMNQKHFKDIVN